MQRSWGRTKIGTYPKASGALHLPKVLTWDPVIGTPQSIAVWLSKPGPEGLEPTSLAHLLLLVAH